MLLSRLARGRPAGIGAYLFVLHRVTGLALTVYLFVHLATLATVLRGPDGFDRAMALMSAPGVRLLELLLVAAVLYHALNGIRLSVLAVWPGAGQRGLAYGVIVLSILLTLASLPFFLH